LQTERHILNSFTQALSPRIWGCIIAVVVLWALAGTVEVLTLRSLSPFQFGAWTTIAGALGTLLYLAARGRLASLLAFRAVDHLKLLGISLLGFGIYFSLKYTAYSTSPVAEASVLQATYMVFIALFAIPILGQEVSFTKLLGVFTGFAGVALIISGGTFTGFEPAFLPGYLCALGAGISFGLFSVLSEKTAFDRLSALFYYQAYSALALTLLLVVQGKFIFPSTGSEIAGIFYNGPVANVLGIFLWLTAQNSARDVSFLTGMLYLVPFFNLVCFFLFLHIPIPLYAFQGLLLIVGGMAIHTVRTRCAHRTALRSVESE
jgi:drug/metabolite transporter (DMT)-like permease